MSYLADLHKLQRAPVEREGPWQPQDMLLVLLKAIEYVIGVVTAQVAAKEEGQTEAELMNYQLGGRLQQLAQLNGCYYTLKAFV